MNQMPSIMRYLGLSVIAAVIALLLSSINYTSNKDIDINGKLLIGGAFIACCCFAASIAVYPGWYKRRAWNGHNNVNESGSGRPQRMLKGHHPDCAFFESHRTYLRMKAICAGCLGILIGSILAIILTFYYIVFIHENLGDSAQILVSIGSLTIFLVYLEIMLSKRNTLLHITSNALMMIGFLFIIIGMLESTGNEVVGLLGILFAFLWMDTRVRISKWHHALLCSRCSEVCKMD